LDLDVDGKEVLAEWVDLDETGVDRAFEAIDAGSAKSYY
jgi:hypothetical protein